MAGRQWRGGCVVDLRDGGGLAGLGEEDLNHAEKSGGCRRLSKPALSVSQSGSCREVLRGDGKV